MGFPPIPSIALLGNYGWGGDFGGFNVRAAIAAASNIVVGANPPYSVGDFLAFYPQFGGTASLVAGTLTAGSDVLVTASIYGFGVGGFGVGGFGSPGVAGGPSPGPPAGGEPGQAVTKTGGCSEATAPPVASWAVGQLITGPGLPTGTVITGITEVDPGTPEMTTNLTLSNNATISGTVNNLVLYTQPLVPLGVLSLYVNLASACLQYGKYLEMWTFAMHLFIAHYATLYARTSGNPATTAGQLAASGAMLGFQSSKAAGDVSTSQENIMSEAFANWGAFNLTVFGEQFISIASVIGMPIMWVQPF